MTKTIVTLTEAGGVIVRREYYGFEGELLNANEVHYGEVGVVDKRVPEPADMLAPFVSRHPRLEK
jgi:hypothetical protein